MGVSGKWLRTLIGIKKSEKSQTSEKDENCLLMESIASVVDKLKGVAKSSEEFLKGVFQGQANSSSRNPIEILKRLQREAFSDLMKLRDRQDKVERMISFYKSNRGSPFQEANTHVKGEIDVVGALLLAGSIDQENCETLRKAGIRTDIRSRFIFDTTIGQKDALVAEFVAGHNDQGYFSDDFLRPLSLAKLMYSANVSDWFSTVVIPVGARCKDVAIASNPFQQERSLTKFSSFEPPLLDHFQGAAAGIHVKRLNVAASVAEFLSILETQPGYIGMKHYLSTFGQIVYQLPKGAKLSIFGLHQMPKLSTQHINLGFLAIPKFKGHNSSMEPSLPPPGMNIEDNLSVGSLALMVESELDESTRIGGWIEMQKSNYRHVQWAVTMSDTPEDELGWGLSIGGMIQGPSNCDHFQVEAWLKFKLGRKLRLQPGLVYVTDGTKQIPAFMLRSSWSL